VAQPPTTVYQLKKFARRNKALVIGIAAVFVVLVGGVVASTWQGNSCGPRGSSGGSGTRSRCGGRVRGH
jgi:hypothetical protein